MNHVGQWEQQFEATLGELDLSWQAPRSATQTLTHYELALR